MSFATSLNQAQPFPAVPFDMGMDDDAWPFISTLEFLDQGVQVFDLQMNMIFANRAARQQVETEQRPMGSPIIEPLPCGKWSKTRWLQIFNELEPSRPLCLGIADGLDSEMTLIRLRHPRGLGDRDVIMVGTRRKAVCSKLAFDAWADATGLTRAERRVVNLLAEGEEPKVAAHLLSITEHTVRTHIRRVLEKAEVRSIKALIRLLAMLPGIASLPGGHGHHDMAAFGRMLRN